MGKQVITRVYQVIKRDGRIVSFDISKIAIAIEKAFEAVHDIDDEIDAISRSVLDEMEKEIRISNLEERRKAAKHECKSLVQSLNSILRFAWLKRNAGAGRSDTSAVSDKMLLTIPTPPTAEAAIRSLWQRGMLNGRVA